MWRLGRAGCSRADPDTRRGIPSEELGVQVLGRTPQASLWRELRGGQARCSPNGTLVSTTPAPVGASTQPPTPS